MSPTDQIIIIGAARSGTRLLRRVLAGSDHVTATPFDLNHIWRRGNEDAPDDVLDPQTCTPAIAQAIAAGLVRQSTGPRDAAILVEKTVSNSLRVPFVRAVFPDARLVHLVRDGREAVLSAIAAWTTPSTWSYRLSKLRTFGPRDHRYLRQAARGSGAPATWGPRYPGIDEDVGRLELHQVVARQWLECVTTAADAFRLAPATLEVRYEDLIDSPECIEALAVTMGLPDVDEVVAAWRSRRRPRPPRWPGDLGPGAQADVLEIIEPGLRRLGYS